MAAGLFVFDNKAISGNDFKLHKLLPALRVVSCYLPLGVYGARFVGFGPQKNIY